MIHMRWVLTQFIREIENKDSPVRPIGMSYSWSETKTFVQAQVQTLPIYAGLKVKITDEGGQNCTWRGPNTSYRTLFKCCPFHLTPRHQVVMYLDVVCADEAWKPLGFKQET